MTVAYTLCVADRIGSAGRRLCHHVADGIDRVDVVAATTVEGVGPAAANQAVIAGGADDRIVQTVANEGRRGAASPHELFKVRTQHVA